MIWLEPTWAGNGAIRFQMEFYVNGERWVTTRQESRFKVLNEVKILLRNIDDADV